MVVYVCSFLVALFPGVGSLPDTLTANFDDYNLSTLCFTLDEKYVVRYFPEAVPLEPIMNKFWIITHECKSRIFSDCWYERLAFINQSQSSDLALSDVAKEVWSPVFSQCMKMLAELKDYSIFLTTVNQLFKGQPIFTITTDIKQLYKGVELCQNGRNVNDFKWIQGVVERMKQFWQLCEFADAAQAVLKIRDVYNLTGDFLLMEKFTSHVRTCYN